MSEIQWIISLLMNSELPEQLKKICLERIGEVESKINNKPIQSMIPIQTSTNQFNQPMSAAQMRDIQLQQQPANAPAMPVHTPLSSLGEVSTGVGNGTSIRGPNKLRGRITP